MKASWHSLLWPLLLSASALATASEPQTRPKNLATGKIAPAQAPTDAEFWDLYDEIADDTGHLPAPEEIPPPKDQLVPSSEQKPTADLEDL
jgi:hypothetical protein